MALTLKQLIIASGNAGTSGQSFLNHVTGAASGTKMSDYVCSGITFTGEPVDDLGSDYASNTLFNIVATIARGSKFYHIQRNVVGAWSFTIPGEATASATVDAFSAAGSPTGATHNIDLRIRGKKNGSPTNTPTADQTGSPPADHVPWAVTYNGTPGSLGGTGTTSLTINWQYTPDTGSFNSVKMGSWTGPFLNRGYDIDVDFDYEWRSADSGGGTLMSTARTFTLTGDTGRLIYSGSDDGLINNGSADNECTIYFRWRIKTSSGGSGSWTNYGAVYYHDERADV